MGSAVQELNAILQPASRHTIEMKPNEIKYKRSEIDVPRKSDQLIKFSGLPLCISYALLYFFQVENSAGLKS